MEPSWQGLTQNYPRLSHSLQPYLRCPALPCPAPYTRERGSESAGPEQAFPTRKAVSTSARPGALTAPGGRPGVRPGA